MPQLVALLAAITGAHPGRYLMCFPSYRYLQQFADALGPAGEGTFVAQAAGADATMLDHLAARPAVVLGIVLGGVFTMLGGFVYSDSFVPVAWLVAASTTLTWLSWLMVRRMGH